MDPPAGKEAMIPPEEEEKKKKKKFWKKKKKKFNLFIPSLSVRYASDEDGGSPERYPDEMIRSEEKTMNLWCLSGDIPGQDKDAFLCTAICDFMFSFPVPEYRYFDIGINEKVMSGLKNCGNSDSVADDVVAIDLRAQDADTVMRKLMATVITVSRNPELKYLKVRVGCTKHGCGRGKLKQAVVDELKRCSIVVDCEEDNGNVISIKLDST